MVVIRSLILAMKLFCMMIMPAVKIPLLSGLSEILRVTIGQSYMCVDSEQ